MKSKNRKKIWRGEAETVCFERWELWKRGAVVLRTLLLREPFRAPFGCLQYGLRQRVQGRVIEHDKKTFASGDNEPAN